MTTPDSTAKCNTLFKNFGRGDPTPPFSPRVKLQGSKRFEPLKRFYELCVDVGESAVSGNPADNLQKLKKIGANPIIGGKKINLNFSFPAEKLRALAGAADLNCAKFLGRKIWRGRRDSNPRSSP